MERSDTNWLDKRAYAFESHFLDVDGGAMHYVDAGTGSPIVFLHGWPSWSFSFRNVIRNVMKENRCIAPDMIGFGLSSKPENWLYSVEAQAQNLKKLFDALDLQDVTLVVHDFGGPVGMQFMLDNPGRVSRLVMMNTWMWDISEEPAARPGKVATGKLGKMAYLKMNAAPKLMKSMICDREKYGETTHKGTFGPFEKQEDRFGAYATAKQLVEGGPTFDEIWARWEAFQQVPLMLLWGTKDATLGEKALNRIWHKYPMAEVHCYESSGRWLMEEQPTAVAERIKAFSTVRLNGGFLA